MCFSINSLSISIERARELQRPVNIAGIVSLIAFAVFAIVLGQCSGLSEVASYGLGVACGISGLATSVLGYIAFYLKKKVKEEQKERDRELTRTVYSTLDKIRRQNAKALIE